MTRVNFLMHAFGSLASLALHAAVTGALIALPADLPARHGIVEVGTPVLVAVRPETARVALAVGFDSCHAREPVR